MKALVFKRYGRPEKIAFADVPKPTPKPDEILVQVHAVGLNPIDYMIPKGTFKAHPPILSTGHAGEQFGRCRRGGGKSRDSLQAGRCRLCQHLRLGHGRTG